ncbi:hypothetical protein SRHO_G00306410 [Serrasalmus rhombeus]
MLIYPYQPKRESEQEGEHVPPDNQMKGQKGENVNKERFVRVGEQAVGKFYGGPAALSNTASSHSCPPNTRLNYVRTLTAT